MANSNYIINNGLQVGPLTIWAANGDVSTSGNVSTNSNSSVSTLYTTSGVFWTGNGAAYSSGGGSGTPGGATTQVQYNDGGSFNGSSSFTFTKSTGNVTVGNLSTTGLGGQIRGYLTGAIGANGANTGAFTTITSTSTITAQGTIAAPTVNAATIGNSGALITGTLQTASQTNITAVGTLTSLAVTGNVTAGNIAVTGVGGQVIGYLTGAIGANVANSGVFTSLTTTNSGQVVGYLNGPIGANSANTGAFTTISATSTSTLRDITPSTANAYNLGTTANYWQQLYATSITGTLQTASQTNITAIGALSSLVVTGNATVGNISTTGVGGQVIGYHTGAIGANVANTGSFTTVTASGNVTVGNLSVAGIGGQVIGYHTGAIGANVANTGAFTSLTSTTFSNIGTSISGGDVLQFGSGVLGTNSTNIYMRSSYANQDIYIYNTGNSTGGIKIAGTSGNTFIQATTASTSNTTGALTVAGGLGVAGNINVGNVITTSGVFWANGAAYTTSSGGSGTPGGSNTYVQFNDAGAFGGIASFAVNKITGNVTVGNIAATGVASQIVGYHTGAIGANAANTGAFTTLTTTGNSTIGGNLILGGATTSLFAAANRTVVVVGGGTSGSIVEMQYNGTPIGSLYGFNALTQVQSYYTLNLASYGQNYPITFQTSNGSILERMRIDSNGNVGIGTSSPTSALHVVGNIITSGGVFWPNGAAYSSGAGSSTSPGGANTYIQFNDAGSFNGTSGFTFNKTSNVVTMSGNISSLRGVFTATSSSNSYTNHLIKLDLASYTYGGIGAVSGASVKGGVQWDSNGTMYIDSNNATGGYFFFNNVSGVSSNLNFFNGNSQFLSVSSSAALLSGPVNIGPNTTTSTSTTTGALVVSGGLGVTGNVYSNSLYTTTGVFWSGNGAAYSSGAGSSTSPGGANTYIQFNDAGSFNGTIGLTFNKTSNLVSMSGNVTAGNISTTGVGGQVIGYHTGAIGANVANTGAFTTVTTTSTITAQGTIAAPTVNAATIGNSSAVLYGTLNSLSASQTNITTVGTLTSLTVSGGTNLGAVSNITITGGTNGYFLQTNGSGTLSWAAASSSTSPGGSNTYVQFNDASSFNGTSGFTFNKTSNLVSMSGNVTAGNISTTGVGGQVRGYITGAIGANVANTGAFTTLTTSSTVTIGSSATGTLATLGSGNAGYITTGDNTQILLVAGSASKTSGVTDSSQTLGIFVNGSTGNVRISTTTTSTSTNTGALTVAGGVGVTGNVYSNSLYTTTGVFWSGNGAAYSSGAGSSTSPGGSNTYVQFNDAGSFGGASGLTYNKGSNAFAIAGSVAIGKTSPAQRLDVQSSSTGNDGIYYYNSGTNASSQAVLQVNTNGATGFSMGQAYSSKNAFLYLADNAQLEFSTNATSRMTISSTGNVAIGTNSGIRAPLVITPSTYSANPVIPNKIRLYDDGAYNVYGFGISGGYLDAVCGQGGFKFSNINGSTGAISTFATISTNQLILNGYDATTALLISGQSKGVRIQPTSTATIIEGVDNSGTSSYQPLYLGGSTLSFTISNSTKMHINADGNVGIGLTNSNQPLSIQNSTQYKGFALFNSTYGPGTQGVAYITGTTATNDAGQLVLSYGGVQKVIIKAVTTSTDVAIAITGGITATDNITAYYSDDRLKTKLGNIENALEKVNLLNGFNYQANDIAQALGYTDKKEVGVSAQEVQKVLPSAVVPAPIDEKYLTVHYERLIPLLIEAVKELSAKVDRLEGKIK